MKKSELDNIAIASWEEKSHSGIKLRDLDYTFGFKDGFESALKHVFAIEHAEAQKQSRSYIYWPDLMKTLTVEED